MIGPDNGQDLTIESNVQLPENQNIAVCVFPNPAKDELHFSADEEIQGVTLYALTGEKVANSVEVSKEIIIPLSSLTPGVYVARCRMGLKEVIRKVLVL